MEGLFQEKIKFNRDAVLGKGSNGTHVYQGTFGQRDIAVKVISCGPQQEKEALREINALIKCDNHPNVVKYYTAQKKEESDGYILLALELCEISLKQWVDEPPEPYQNISKIDILYQATNGLAHLHSIGNGMVHRDIKPENILLTRVNNVIYVKIADFGISKTILDGRSSVTLSAFAGTEEWTAPEILWYIEDQQRQSTGGPQQTITMTLATDIFSLGCVYYYILSNGQHPFGDKKIQRQSNIIEYHPIINEGHFHATELGNLPLIQAMIARDPGCRPPALYLLAHHLFWTPAKTLQFLVDISNSIERMDSHQEQCCQQLVHNYQIGREGWLSKTDTIVQHYLKHNIHRTYNGHSVKDLIRAIRNLQSHYQTLSQDVQDCVGTLPDEFIIYWTQKFPYLVPHVWEAFSPLKDTASYGLVQYYIL